MKRLLLYSAIFLFLAMTLLPLLYMLGVSLTRSGGISLAHYITVFQGARELTLLWNSFAIAALSSLFAFLLGFPFAVLISRTDLPLRWLFKVFYIVPLLIPPYITTIAWSYLLAPEGAILRAWNWAFSGLNHSLNLGLPLPYGASGKPETLFKGMGWAVFIFSFSYFPMVVLLASHGLRRVDGCMEEAARVYRGWKGAIWGVALKLSLPHGLAGALFVFLFTLSSYSVPSLLGVNTFTIEVFSQFKSLNMGQATATSFPFVAVALAVILAVRFFEKKKGVPSLTGKWIPPSPIPLGRGAAFGFLFCVLVVFIGAGVPLAVLLSKAGGFGETIENAREEIKNSLLFASLGATITVTIGMLLAYWIVRSPSGRARILRTIVLVPYALPATVLGVGLLGVWNRPGFGGWNPPWLRELFRVVYDTQNIILICTFARFIPFVAESIAQFFRQIHPSLEEAAILSGISWTRSFIRVVLPLGFSGLVVAWIMAFVLSVGELDATLVVAPAGYHTIPQRIFNMVHFGYDEKVSALCLILIGIILFPILLYTLITQKYPSLLGRNGREEVVQ